MAPTKGFVARPGLERSCTKQRDWVRVAPGTSGFERFECYFAGHAFDPHRHDTYALGMTLAGVQAFRYKGADARSVPGTVFVLHPDEVHDGHAGTEDGFRYRILYVAPSLVRDVLGKSVPLPFVRDAVSTDPRLAAAVARALGELHAPMEEIEQTEIVADVAAALALADRSARYRRRGPYDHGAVARVRAFLDADPCRKVASRDLEKISGLDRYALARHFRAGLGTSPYRYLTMRRLDRARTLLANREVPAAVAAACGFADQSHLTRQFKAAYGVTPGRWAKLVSA